MPEFYSDRTNGPVAPDADELPTHSADALYSYATHLIERNYLARAYPLQCPDGQGIAGTDAQAFWKVVDGLIPRLRGNDPCLPRTPPDDAIFDPLELIGRDVAAPADDRFHPYFKHHELKFDRAAGAAEFREAVNEFLARGGTSYQMNGDMILVRRAPINVRDTLATLAEPSEDDRIDELFASSLKLYSLP